jgi:hypothetical protein
MVGALGIFKGATRQGKSIVPSLGVSLGETNVMRHWLQNRLEKIVGAAAGIIDKANHVNFGGDSATGCLEVCSVSFVGIYIK